MSQSNESPRAPTESVGSVPQKATEDTRGRSVPDVRRRHPDAVTRVVRLWTALGRRTVEVDVSPLATEPATVELARKRRGIPPELFRRGEVAT